MLLFILKDTLLYLESLKPHLATKRALNARFLYCANVIQVTLKTSFPIKHESYVLGMLQTLSVFW